jgi:collagenase-like PrtC family protease
MIALVLLSQHCTLKPWVRPLPLQVMTYLHDRDAKGYVVLNVLVFDEELQRMEERVRQVAQAGVDAVIVQVGHLQACMQQTP